MKSLARVLAVGALVLLLPSLGWTQASTDFSEMQQWVKDSEHQPDIPIGTKITTQNYQQYKAVLPLGMIKLFEGQYFWKIPPDAVLEVGPTHLGSRLPSFQAATEKYSSQVEVKLLPNGHYQLLNFHGGVPFPNPTGALQRLEGSGEHLLCVCPCHLLQRPANNYGTVWAVDKYGNVSPYRNDVVYAWTCVQYGPRF